MTYCIIFQKQKDGSFQEGTKSKIKAIFINTEVVICRLSVATSYMVAISNDGTTVSQYYRYITYDSNCETCTLEKCTARVSRILPTFKYQSCLLSDLIFVLFVIKNYHKILKLFGQGMFASKK